MTAVYEHRQKGGLAFWAVFAGLVAAAAGYGSILIKVQVEGPLYWLLLASWVFAVGVLGYATVLMRSLTVRVDGEEIVVRFGGGVWRKRFGLGDVVSARPVRNPWLYGWGIHWGSSGWLYNVAGFEAVELTFRDGRRARIGTDEPDKLAGAIGAHIKQND